MRFETIGKVLALASLLIASGVTAQDEPPANPSQMSAEDRQAARQARREAFENMTDEERAAAREERGNSGRGDRRNMTDEERQAARERFQNMTDEERQAARESRRAEGGMRSSGSRGGRGGRGGSGGGGKRGGSGG